MTAALRVAKGVGLRRHRITSAMSERNGPGSEIQGGFSGTCPGLELLHKGEIAEEIRSHGPDTSLFRGGFESIIALAAGPQA